MTRLPSSLTHPSSITTPPEINDAPPIVVDAHVIDYAAAVTVYYQVVNAPDATNSIDDHGVVVSGLQTVAYPRAVMACDAGSVNHYRCATAYRNPIKTPAARPNAHPIRNEPLTSERYQ